MTIRIRTSILVCAASFLLFASSALANDNTSKELSFVDALKGGKVKISLRYRFEGVDDDGFADEAEASTLRTSLSYRTGEYRGFSAFLEAEDVTPIFDDDNYNNAGAGSLSNDVRGVPVVADPALTEINQAYLRWRNDRITVTAGRQAINIGDQRFVGAVAWRQNHQSFDALRIAADLSPKIKLDYTFATAVRRIFGDRQEMESHLFHLPITLAKDHKLAPYGFWLDYDDLRLLSTATYGIEYTGKVPLSDRFALRFELEAAQQDDQGDNPATIDTDYFLASIGGQGKGWGIDLTWEVLGDRGDGALAFQTPLSTLHKWNGWADKFLRTPDAGLETLYVRFKGTLGSSWRYAVVYHDFTSHSGDIDYGTEIDGELVYTTPWKQTFALKVAVYDADEFSTDTQKVMLWSSYSF
ncbi:MAG: alginate export family protein [Acidobacteriota bacterium]